MRIALHGGLYSGKTELAEALAKRGYYYISYTDLLKEYAVKALAACGVIVTIEEIKADKEKYRWFLVYLGTILGWDEGAGIEKKVRPIGSYPDIVFDNVRLPAQMDILRRYGFRLVRLTTSEEVRLERALAKGLTEDEFYQRTDSYTEIPLSPYPNEIQIANEGDINSVVTRLLANPCTDSAA